MNDVLEKTEEKMVKAIDSLESKFVNVRAGRANPNMLDGVMVEYYGTPTPIKSLANISVPEARQLVIKPFDRSCLSAIEKAIFEANLGVTPNNNGEVVFIVIPALTEDRRKELVKQVKSLAEEAKIALRNIRQDANGVLKNLKLVDVFTGEIVESNVAVKDGLIAGVSRSYRGKKEIDLGGRYLAPGYIDAHLHLESTMVTPNELVCTAAKHGTTTFIVDPHEAANVSGAAGIDYILNQTEKSPANVYVMMPSCVPSTSVDDNGCVFSANDMYPYVRNPRVLGLGEVMDDPAVIHAEESMFVKMNLFENRTIDGHAPYLPNKELSAYKISGFYTDHDATTF